MSETRAGADRDLFPDDQIDEAAEAAAAPSPDPAALARFAWPAAAVRFGAGRGSAGGGAVPAGESA